MENLYLKLQINFVASVYLKQLYRIENRLIIFVIIGIQDNRNMIQKLTLDNH